MGCEDDKQTERAEMRYGNDDDDKSKAGKEHFFSSGERVYM